MLLEIVFLHIFRKIEYYVYRILNAWKKFGFTFNSTLLFEQYKSTCIDHNSGHVS